MRLSEGMADSISRSIDGNVKLVHFFREYDQENKKTQEMVEQQLENFLIDLDKYEDQPFLMKDQDLSKLINISYRLMVNALRAAKRGFDSRLRGRLIWVIVLLERYKQVPKRYQSIRGIKNLLLLFKTLYTYLIDKHIRLTTLIEDDLVLKIKQLSTQTASVFDDAMRDLVDSEESVDSTKALVEKSKKDKKGEDLLEQYFVTPT